MAEHPLIAIYFYGLYGWLIVLGFNAIVCRHQFKIFVDDASRQLEVSPATFVIVISLAYTVAWPITVLFLLAYLAGNDKR